MRVNRQKSVATAAMLQTFRDHLRDVDAVLGQAVAIMEGSDISAIGPLGISSIERATEALLSAASVAVNLAKKQQRTKQREAAEIEAAVDFAAAQPAPKKRGRPPKKRSE